MTEVSKVSNKSNNLPDQVEGKRDLIRALVLCLLAVGVVRSFLFEPFKIPSSSMVPTLKIGDHIFVSKFNYGLSIPFTKILLVTWGQPERGDIIVFLYPKDESLHYIKRVVGIPGDKIEFRGKDLLVNDQLVPKEQITESNMLERVYGMQDGATELYREDLGKGSHFVQYSKRTGAEYARTPQTEIVPPNRFFVVGDNRDESYDSRFWGYVSRENIKGKATMIWLSLDQKEDWSQLTKIRWSRCGTLIK